jgi:hypothetical protein
MLLRKKKFAYGWCFSEASPTIFIVIGDNRNSRQKIIPTKSKVAKIPSFC